MQFSAITREAAEKVYTVGRNREGATITQNDVACYDMTTSFDGLWVMQTNAADALNMAGVADENIADNDYGRIQSWGYRASINVSAEGTSITITKGDWCQPVAGTWGVSSMAIGSPNGVVAGNTTVAISAAGYISGFIRCI